MEKKNPGKGSHHSPRDTTQIAIAPDPPRRRRALARRRSCILTKPTKAGQLESGCFPRDSLSCFGLDFRFGRTEPFYTKPPPLVPALLEFPSRATPNGPGRADGLLWARKMQQAPHCKRFL